LQLLPGAQQHSADSGNGSGTDDSAFGTVRDSSLNWRWPPSLSLISWGESRNLDRRAASLISRNRYKERSECLMAKAFQSLVTKPIHSGGLSALALLSFWGRWVF